MNARKEHIIKIVLKNHKEALENHKEAITDILKRVKKLEKRNRRSKVFSFLSKVSAAALFTWTYSEIVELKNELSIALDRIDELENSVKDNSREG